MATLADPTWVEYWLELGDVHVLDPRPSLDYNRGHLPGAVNVPLERLFDERGALLPDEALGAVFGEAGVDESKRSLVYDECRRSTRRANGLDAGVPGPRRGLPQRPPLRRLGPAGIPRFHPARNSHSLRIQH